MLNVTDANFGEVLGAPSAIVDFWSPTCPYCMQFKPIFEEVAAQLGNDHLFVEANVNEAMQSAGKFGVQSLPTIVFLKNGKEVNRIEGATSKADFLAEISRSAGGAGSSGGIPAGSSSGGGVSLLGGLAAAGILGAVIYGIAKSV